MAADALDVLKRLADDEHQRHRYSHPRAWDVRRQACSHPVCAEVAAVEQAASEPVHCEGCDGRAHDACYVATEICGDTDCPPCGGIRRGVSQR